MASSEVCGKQQVYIDYKYLVAIRTESRHIIYAYYDNYAHLI